MIILFHLYIYIYINQVALISLVEEIYQKISEQNLTERNFLTKSETTFEKLGDYFVDIKFGLYELNE